METSEPVEIPHKPVRRSPRRRMTRLGILAIALAILVGMLGGLGGFTFGYGKGYAYLSNNPAACTNCHVMQDAYDAWQKSSHHNVATCGDCHLPHDFIGHWLVEADNGTFHSIAFTTGNFHEPIQIKARNRRVTQNACVHCHQDTVDQMLPAEQGGEMLNCIQCHNDVGHAGRRRGSVGANPREP